MLSLTELSRLKDPNCLQARDFLILGVILWAQNKAGPKAKSPVPVPPGERLPAGPSASRGDEERLPVPALQHDGNVH